jgi:hypothetical protein
MNIMEMGFSLNKMIKASQIWMYWYFPYYSTILSVKGGFAFAFVVKPNWKTTLPPPPHFDPQLIPYALSVLYSSHKPSIHPSLYSYLYPSLHPSLSVPIFFPPSVPLSTPPSFWRWLDPWQRKKSMFCASLSDKWKICRKYTGMNNIFRIQ